MNYNEEFKRNILIKLAENININFENQQSVERILVELLQDYTVIKNETSLTISDIPEKITMYLQAKKLEGLSDLTLQNYFYFLRKLSEHTHKQIIKGRCIKMNIYNKEMNSMLAILGTIFTWLFGAWDLSLMILVTVMALDYVTGVTRGYVNKQLSSEYGFRGLAKKLTIFYVLILSVIIDRMIGNGWIFRTLVCFWYTGNEGASVLENAVAIGLPVPAQLVDALEQLKQGNKKYKEVE